MHGFALDQAFNSVAAQPSRRERVGAIKLRLSTETLRLYARAWARCARFCAEHGQPALPTSSDTVTAFLVQSGAGRAALGRYLAAIDHKHRQHELAPPHRDHDLRAAFRLMGRTVPRISRRHPPAPAQLQNVAQSCPEDLAGRRDRALLLLAAAELGRAALVGLQAEQLRFTERGVTCVVAGAESTR